MTLSAGNFVSFDAHHLHVPLPGAARPSHSRDLLHRVQSLVGVFEWCLRRAVRPRPLLLWWLVGFCRGGRLLLLLGWAASHRLGFGAGQTKLTFCKIGALTKADLAIAICIILSDDVGQLLVRDEHACVNPQRCGSAVSLLKSA